VASVAIRYARAFADVVIDLNLDPNHVRDELRLLVHIVKDSPDLRKVWENPAVKHSDKVRLLDAIAKRAGLETPVRNFMAVLIEHGRTAALAAIVRQFELELNQRLGFIEADVTSARELSAEEKSGLERQVGRLTGHKVRARYGTDKSLLGGAVVKIGSTVYDGSLRGQLRRIKEQLSAG
jgi:F-type H+-transporting ATPase subunit delta